MEINILIPVYRNVNLLKGCIESLLSNIHEIAEYSPNILIFNDSPDDSEVSEYLHDLQIGFKNKKEFPVEIKFYTNDMNIGFVKTVNKGLEITAEEKRSAILINSDTITFQNTLKNLIISAYSDPQVGVACPRSNNASLATFPHYQHPRSGTMTNPAATYEAWKDVAYQLPHLTYTPTAVGYYLLIKEKVLFTFKSLDEIFGKGYEEENDFIMRINKVGYLAALANHSFAFHYGSASFKLVTQSLDDDKSRNLKIMAERNPEFLPIVKEFWNSPQFFAERLLSNLLSVDGKYDIVFDLRRMWLSHNGTTVSTKVLLKAICDAGINRFNFYALCSENAYNFHSMNKIENLRRVEKAEGRYAVAINMAQPFDLDEINTLENLAPLNIYGMLDIIALDCGYLRLENNFLLEEYWGHVFKYADGIFYNSEFTYENFSRRFSSYLTKNENQINFPLLLPTEIGSYNQNLKPSNSGRRHIFIAGNHFKHKWSKETAEKVSSAFNNTKIICMADKNLDVGNIQYIKSGEVPESDMAQYLSEASMLILPSLYEGFGIGLVEALSYGLAVIARNIQPVNEILKTYETYSGVYLYDTDEELFSLVENHSNEVFQASGGITTKQWGKYFCEFIDKVITKNCKFENICERFLSTRHLNENMQLRKFLSTSPIYEEMNFKNILLNVFNKTNDDDFIRDIYLLLLSRDPDPEGLNTYRDELQNKNSTRFQLFQNILTSEEFVSSIF